MLNRQCDIRLPFVQEKTGDTQPPDESFLPRNRLNSQARA
jgi:hypothetical protein